MTYKLTEKENKLINKRNKLFLPFQAYHENLILSLPWISIYFFLDSKEYFHSLSKLLDILKA